MSVIPLVSSATAISPVTITLVITNIGVTTCINPVPYQEPGIFWSPNASSLPALTASRKHAIDDSQRPSNDKIADKEEEVDTPSASKKATFEDTVPIIDTAPVIDTAPAIVANNNNVNLPTASPFIIIPQVYS